MRRQFMGFAIFILVLSACFARPLLLLLHYTLHSEFFSYILLIPVISLYLVWVKKTELPTQSPASWKGGVVAALGGLAVLGLFLYGLHAGWKLHAVHTQDYLTLMTSAYLCFVVAGCLVCLGGEFSKAIAFPIGFLVFMIPLPSAVFDWVTGFFQLTSAMMADLMLKTTGMTVFRDHLYLNLPGYAIAVDPECSGIHSTMVLLITAVLAGYLFLRTTWKRGLLILLIVPLAIVRNGFRIYVISEMCVHISHTMIDSPVHRKGGPLFFALSLIPFFIVLLYLRKSEFPAPKTAGAPVKS